MVASQVEQRWVKRLLLRLWIVSWAIMPVLFLYPINNTVLRASMLLAILGSWAGCLYFSWHKKMIRLALIVLTMGVAGFLICPGKSHDSKKLRADYVRSLRTYEGTPYVWGGENKYGIDCSGLVRGGLIKADYWQGISTLNPRLVRESLSLWWHDSSAEALGAEYRHQTRRLLTAPSINDLDHSKILPGDIAVTTSGVHTLAYIGERTWIEADPHFKLVIIVKTPVKNPWFEEPVKIMRWAQLEVGSAETGD